MPLQRAAKHILGGRYARALAELDKIKPGKRGDPALDLMRGHALRGLGRHREATVSLVRCARDGGPHAAEAWTLAGLSFQATDMPDEALDAFREALSCDGGIEEARNNACALLVQNKDHTGALPHARWLLAHCRDSSFCLNAALVFAALEMHEQTLAAARRVLQKDPEEPSALSIGVRAAQRTCDWEALSRFTKTIADTFYGKGRFEHALEKHFSNISWCMVPEWNLAVARSAVKRQVPQTVLPYDHSGHRFSSPLRVGYVSGDFHDHPVLYLTAGLFEHHDPARIQVFAYCHANYEDSWLRQRFEKAVPNLVCIGDLSDDEAADRIFADNIDVLVDCMGFTKNNRQGIFARRPAPVQATWLGFPGTTGADYMDYIVADPVVAPHGSEVHFSEHVCRLPETYFCNDKDRIIASNPVDRAGQGLPAKGVVFCCMNQPYKLESVRFATFMAILKDVPGSVLWLLDPGDIPRENLRRAARDAGVHPDRLVFAEMSAAVPLHLARLELADIALDTRIYSGHTTSVDALWAGVPVVATRGAHFASRVPESLLRAVNMPELMTDDEAGIYKLSVELALNPDKLRTVREKLGYNKLRSPLFDTERFTRHMETAFSMMADRGRKGLPPAAIDVPAMPRREGVFATEVPRCRVEAADGEGANSRDIHYPSMPAEPGIKARSGVEKIVEEGYIAQNQTKLTEKRIRSSQMHIFTDGIKSVSMSNNNLRITLIQNGTDNTQNDVATLIVPANQAANFVNAMANGLKQIDEQMKARAEAQKEAQAEADKSDVQ